MLFQFAQNQFKQEFSLLAAKVGHTAGLLSKDRVFYFFHYDPQFHCVDHFTVAHVFYQLYFFNLSFKDVIPLDPKMLLNLIYRIKAA